MAVGNQKISLSFNLVWLTWLLGLIIIGMLVMWRPWQAETANRSIAVSGQSTISAQPDEFVFYPTFELTDSDQAQLKARITNLVDETVAALKAIGVTDSQIKLNAYGGEDYYFVYPGDKDSDYRVSATLTVTSTSQEQSQSIQDLLINTDAQGQLTPTVQFSESKRQELETQAREEAIANAKTKAEQSASLLGAKLGKVIEVSESSNFDVIPVDQRATEVSPDGAAADLPVLPGENEFSYFVNVKFAIR